MSRKEKPKFDETLVRSWANGGDEDEESPSDDDAQPSPANDREDLGDDEGVDMGDQEIEPLPLVTQEDDN